MSMCKKQGTASVLSKFDEVRDAPVTHHFLLKYQARKVSEHVYVR